MSRAPRRPYTRREALRLIGLGATALYLPGLPGCGPAEQQPPKAAPRAKPAPDPLEQYGPIDRGLPYPAPARYSGDDPGRAHKLLWDKPGYLSARGGLPEPSEKVALAVIGGGLSGLASAWLLRRHQPIVLERAPRFGGNSRGESWQGIDYSIGAAYFLKPKEGSALDGLLREIGAAGLWREHKAQDPVALDGVRHDGFWKGATDPARKDRFERLAGYFRDVLEEKNGRFYPEIPVADPALRRKVNALDRVTFLRHLERVAGGRLHPHIETAIEHFCWSSFGASAQVVSAASGLNFYAAELDPLLVCPGGNAAVAEALVKRLAAGLPPGHLRPGALVVDVRARQDGVQVTYEDERGTLRSLAARAAVIACPKFAVAKLLHGIEPERLAAIGRLRYNAYLVANVLLKGAVKDDFYDLFLLGDGNPARDTRAASDRQCATDAVLATYAKPQPDRAVLTLYRAFPFAGGRGRILDETGFAAHRAQFEQQLAREVLPALGRQPADVADVRIARWGHPLPVAAAGLIAGGVPERLRAPFEGRVFFVEQDNWALPAFETAMGEALHFAPEVDKVLAA